MVSESSKESGSINPKTFSLNTGNPGKYAEFERLFEARGCKLTMTQLDVDEITAEPELVAAHKASQMDDQVIIEDTSLEVEGEQVGIHIKYLLDTLDQHVGKRALWRVLLAFKQADAVLLFKGEVTGQIVASRGEEGFGFDPYFLPDGARKTLAEHKPDRLNARAQAVDALIEQRVWKRLPVISDWEGDWQ